MTGLSFLATLHVDSATIFLTYWLLGVQKSGIATQKKSAPKQRIKRPYTARQVDKVNRIVSRVRQGDLPASKLEQVVEFLAKLKE